MNTQSKARKNLSATEARNLRRLLLLNVFAPETIGLRIKRARDESGMTQEELGDLVHLSTRSIQGYEAGEVKPFKHLDRIAAVLGRPVEWFLRGDEPDAEPSDVDLRQTITELREDVRQMSELFGADGAMQRELEEIKAHLLALGERLASLPESE